MTKDITIIRASGTQPTDKGIEVCLTEENVRDQAKHARGLFLGLQQELDAIEDNIKDGLSYLDMKNDTLLSYMIDLCNIILRKVRGDSISDHPSIERTVYYRVILEKIKAIDQRLAYQLNKVITMPDNAGEEIEGVNIKNLDVDLGSEDEEDEGEKAPSRVNRDRNQNDLEEDSEDSGEEDDEDDEDAESVDSAASEQDDEGSDLEDEPIAKGASKSARPSGSEKRSGVYKPPKLRSVAYDDGETVKTKRRRDHNEFYQDDDDVHDIVEETRARVNDERIRYEEENYTRLPDMNPKKAKRKAKQAKSKGKKKFKGGGKRK